MDDYDDLKKIRRWTVWFIIAILLIGGISEVVSRAFDLAWFPWQIRQQTGMIRASNSYVTTQQTALRQLRTDYEGAATDGQKAAIKAQMTQIADLIPGDVQPDIRAFLNGSN